jgi:hypothetical protein
LGTKEGDGLKPEAARSLVNEAREISLRTGSPASTPALVPLRGKPGEPGWVSSMKSEHEEDRVVVLWSLLVVVYVL